MDASKEFGRSAFALLAGISQFDDPAFCQRPLGFAENDVSDFKQFLCDSLGWQNGNCRVLRGRVTKNSLMEAFNSHIELARSAAKRSLFLFYISTHGQFFDDENHRQTGVLLASDTRVVNLPTALETGIANQFLSGFLRETKSLQKLIISDACFAGTAASAHDVTPLSFYEPVDASVLASSRWESFIPPQGHNSLFTECLISVLRRIQGAATLPTFFEQVWSSVRKGAALLGKDQEPILSHQGGIIIVGYLGESLVPPGGFEFDEIVKSSATLLESRLARVDQDGFGSDVRYIARRDTEGAFWNFLGQSDKTAFTVVGSAGSGKSTTMAQLALEATKVGHLALWFGGDLNGATEPQSEINHLLERLAPAFTLPDAIASLPKGKQILVFFDGVNEWDVDRSSARAFLAKTLALAGPTSFRLIVSCRDTAWPELSEPFTANRTFRSDPSQPTAGVVSSTLAAFNEEEFRQALHVYGGIERLAIGNLARQPLFLRVTSRLHQASERRPQHLSILDVFDEYLRLRVEKIARRIMLRPDEVLEAIDHITRTNLARRSDSLSRAAFFAAVPEALAISLLDEGLFKYSGEEITVEADVVHEHLLSRVLPRDILLSFDRFTEVLNASRLASGAVVFRLCGMRDPGLVVTALRWLDQHDRLDVLDALERLPLLGPYWDFFGPWISRADGMDWLIADALKRRMDRELDFCLKAARAMFVKQNYFPWEAKRWRDVPFWDFRRQVGFMRGAPELLAQCAEYQPRIVIPLLLQEWLPDETPLSGGGSYLASIGGTARIYLAMFGQRLPEIVFPALTQWIETRSDSEISIDPILAHLAHMIPAETAEYAASWTERFPGLVLTVLAELPVESARAAIPLADSVIVRHLDNANLVESIIAAAGRYGSREALDLVIRAKDRRELLSGLIVALTRLYRAFTKECENLASDLCWRPNLSDKEVGYACSFYAVAATSNPDIAVRFFRYGAALERPEVARSVSYQLINLVKSGQPGFQELVEKRLRVEQDRTALFNYVIALENYRTLRSDDLEWLTRWISTPSFRETDYVIKLLLASNIPASEIKGIVFLMEKESAALEYLGPSVRLQELAKEVIVDDRFRSLREYSKRIWRMVAEGMDPQEASRTALDVLMRQRRKH